MYELKCLDCGNLFKTPVPVQMACGCKPSEFNELTSLQAENKRLEGEVLDMKRLLVVSDDRSGRNLIRAEKAEKMLLISTTALKQECDRSHVLAENLSDTEGAVLDLIEANDRAEAKLHHL